MHQDFANWYQPVSFNHEPSVINLRWEGTTAAAEDIDSTATLELIKFVFGQPFQSVDSEHKFRQYFKTLDPTFQMSGNDAEVQTLAGCVLALFCSDAYDFDLVPLAILTTAACKTKKTTVEIDLIGMAEARILKDGHHARKRPTPSELKTISNKKVFETAAASVVPTPGWEVTAAALKKIGVTADNMFVATQKSTHSEISTIHNLLKIQDEELQMLWWMVTGWSEMWDSPFSDIDSKARPLMLAKEAASLTEESTESPSLKSVFSRLGIAHSDEVSIQEAVNACGAQYLEKLTQCGAICPIIYPLNFAMSRAQETAGGEAWVAGWSQVTGIDEKARTSSLALAVQAHRELKLMSIANDK